MVKFLRYLIAIAIKYLIIIILSFILTTFFDKSEKKNRFLNFQPQNYQLLIKTTIETLIKKDNDKKITFLKNEGSAIYPIFFNKIKTDSSNKDKYIKLYHDIGISILDIDNKNFYNINHYKNGWEKLEYYYSEQYINELLTEWSLKLIDDNFLLNKLNNLGSYRYYPLLKYILINYKFDNYDNIKILIKNIYQFFNNPPFKKEEIDKKKEVVWEWINLFFIKKKGYYEQLNLSNRLKIGLTHTKFYSWFEQVSNLSFGTFKTISIYHIFTKYFINSILFFIFSIFLSYFIALSIIIKIFKKKGRSFIKKSIDKSIFILTLLPAIVWIIITSIFKNNFLILNGGVSGLLYYIFVVNLLILPTLYFEFKIAIQKVINLPYIEFLDINGVFQKDLLNLYINKILSFVVIEKISQYIIYFISIIFLTEYFFNYNGIGNLFFISLELNNLTLLRVSILYIGVFIVFINIIISVIKKLLFKKDETIYY